MAATTYQKEMMKTLRKREFEPIGFRKDGHLVIRHKSGFQTNIASTPGDHKDQKNMMGTIERGIKFMEQAGPRFEQWMFRKWNVEPGETKLVECSLREQARRFTVDEGVKGASWEAIATWTARREHWTNTQPDKKGRGKRIWEVTRPLETEIVEEYVEEPLVLVADQLEHDVPDLPPEPEPPSTIPVVIDPLVIERLTEVLSAPVKAELQDRDEKLQLALAELEVVDQRLSRQYEELCSVREMLLNLASVLKG